MADVDPVVPESEIPAEWGQEGNVPATGERRHKVRDMQLCDINAWVERKR